MGSGTQSSSNSSSGSVEQTGSAESSRSSSSSRYDSASTIELSSWGKEHLAYVDPRTLSARRPRNSLRLLTNTDDEPFEHIALSCMPCWPMSLKKFRFFKGMLFSSTMLFSFVYIWLSTIFDEDLENAFDANSSVPSTLRALSFWLQKCVHLSLLAVSLWEYNVALLELNHEHVKAMVFDNERLRVPILEHYLWIKKKNAGSAPFPGADLLLEAFQMKYHLLLSTGSNWERVKLKRRLDNLISELDEAASVIEGRGARSAFKEELRKLGLVHNNRWLISSRCLKLGGSVLGYLFITVYLGAIWFLFDGSTRQGARLYVSVEIISIISNVLVTKSLSDAAKMLRIKLLQTAEKLLNNMYRRLFQVERSVMNLHSTSSGSQSAPSARETAELHKLLPHLRAQVSEQLLFFHGKNVELSTFHKIDLISTSKHRSKDILSARRRSGSRQSTSTAYSSQSDSVIELAGGSTQPDLEAIQKYLRMNHRMSSIPLRELDAILSRGDAEQVGSTSIRDASYSLYRRRNRARL